MTLTSSIYLFPLDAKKLIDYTCGNNLNKKRSQNSDLQNASIFKFNERNYLNAKI